MAVIAVVGLKGGTGKTTVAISLADAWCAAGKKILLVDGERDGYVSAWHARATDPEERRPTVFRLSDQLAFSEYDATVIDCPSNDATVTLRALEAADLALIPTNSSPLELAALQRTFQLIDGARIRNLQVRVLLARVASSDAARDVRDQLCDRDRRVLETELGVRAAFAEALERGSGVTRRAPRSRAAVEIRALMKELASFAEDRAADSMLPAFPDAEARTDPALNPRAAPAAPPPAIRRADPGGFPEIFGGYHLRQLWRRGGTADIFIASARDRESGAVRHVVIKRPLLDTELYAKMLADEAELMASFDHPTIVRVESYGQLDGEPYLALEYVDGLDLLRMLANAGRLRRGFSSDISLHIILQVLEALTYIHDVSDANGVNRRIVHRDLSPANILVSFTGQVKLCDFGISKVSDREATDPGVLKGKFGYMSPEQVEGRTVDLRTDLFVVGILLYELLTGHRLFQGTNLEVLKRIARAEIHPPIRAYRPDINPELEHIVLRALSRHPLDRFGSAREMSGALRRYVDRRRAWVEVGELGRFARELTQAEPEWRERRTAAGLPPIS